MVRVLISLIVLSCGWVIQPLVVFADSIFPENRYVIQRDTDHFGADLGPLFETDMRSCARACTAQPDCAGFAFNSRSNACFPKSAMDQPSPYEGAFSALKLTSSRAQRQAADARAAALQGVQDDDLAQAAKQAQNLGLRFPTGGASVDDLVAAAQSASPATALRWTAEAVVLSDRSDLWLDYARRLLRQEVQGSAQRRAHEAALSAALNSYLRGPDDAAEAQALATAAEALEQLGRGRDALGVLRLAAERDNSPKLAARLDDAIAKYGFRITGSRVESDSASPRICVEFSEDLARSGVEYDDFIKLADPRLVAESAGRELCVDGVEHGTRYRLTLRRGLPAVTGETLAKDVTLTHYVRDRGPSVRFSGRSYVLPKGDQVAVPVETVNATTLDLRLRRVSDRNLLRSLQEDYFARPLSQWQEEQFASDIAEEIWSGTAEVSQALNQTVTTRLPLDQALADQPVGIYALSAQLPGADPYDSPAATQWFVLTDLGLSTMLGSDGLHVQVQGLSDAAPRAGVRVELISNANAVLGTAVSDAEGYAHFDAGLTRGQGASAPAMLMAQTGEAGETAADFAFLSLRDAAFDLSDRGVEGRVAPGPIDVFLTTDRGAYRAGEVIHATVLARDATAQAITGLPLIAVLNRPDGVEYARLISDRGVAGGHVFALPVGDTAPRGTWRLSILSDPKAPPLASRQILVEDFLPERIDFTQTLTAAAGQELRPGTNSPLRIEARYLFGAPGRDLSIDGEVTLRPADQLAGWDGYRFGRYDDVVASQSRHFGGARTDAEGIGTLSVALPEIEALGQPLVAEVTTRLSDGSARPVERQLSVALQPDGPVIGIKPLFEDVVAEGAAARFSIVALAPDGSPQDMPVTWTLNRVETRYQWYQLYGNWNWEPTTRRSRVATGAAKVNAATPLVLEQPVDWGRYELVVEHQGVPYVAASSDFYAGWYVPDEGADTPDQLEVSLDRDSYKPGDTARLRVVSRGAGTALVSVMSNRLISRQMVEVPAGETVIPLSVAADWGSGAYVSAMVVQPLAGKADQSPIRALGLAHATVIRPEQDLQVMLDLPEVARPRRTELAKVEVRGAAPGEEVWLTLAAVDLGILNLTGFQSPDPSAHYYGQRRLGMELRDLYGRLIETGTGALGRVRSGGDAGAGMRLQSPPPTQDLMAVFSGPVKLDAEGRAEVPITLPPFNGTVRVMAVAWSQSAVGQAAEDMLVRDPVVVSATAPRFLAPGDSSRVQIEVTHADGPAGRLELEARTLGAGLEIGALPQSLVLAPGGSETVILPVAALSVGDPEIELTLTTAEGETLIQTLRLPVRANDPMVATTRRFQLAAGNSFLFSSDVFTGLRPENARAVMSAGPLARFDVPGLLNGLDLYPYGCTEQVTSRALPLLYLSSVAKAAGLGGGPEVTAKIDSAIRQVLARQASNGGFGLWRAESGDFWLDAYVSDFLSRARAQGYQVAETRFRQALDNLRNRVNYAPDFDTGGEDIAYALLVLAREGEAAMGDLRYYADVKAGDFATPLSVAQVGAALAAYGDQRRADQMFARAAAMLHRAAPDPTLWRADYGSLRRDQAGVLALASEAGSEAVDRRALSAGLVGDGQLLSTQESAWTLMAAHALIGGDGGSGLLVNGQTVNGPMVEVLEGDQDRDPLALTAASGKDVDITLTTLGVPLVAAPAGGTGYSIERSYYSMEGEALVPDQFTVGDRFVAVLRVVPFEPAGARLMINDPLPAGLEIDNPSLLRSGDVRGLDWLTLSEARHAEFRADRFLAAVDLRRGRNGEAGAPVRLAYVARAVTPGLFHHPAASVEDMYRPAYRARTATGRVQVR
ncbi:alpha-2-macroglobulin family protein [Phaeobacter inhibens]|uniref:alpha-2-macroglobulin family protein n=1 Tax=Phaeobacter inhibens TaxID=221822 RepID=UPI004057AA3C